MAAEPVVCLCAADPVSGGKNKKGYIGVTRVIWGLYWDNGKNDGDYHLWFRVYGLGYRAAVSQENFGDGVGGGLVFRVWGGSLSNLNLKEPG